MGDESDSSQALGDGIYRMTDTEKQLVIDSVLAEHKSGALDAERFRSRIIEVLGQLLSSGAPEAKWAKVFESVKREDSKL